MRFKLAEIPLKRLVIFLSQPIISASFKNAGIAQLVERNLAKVEVASSNLVSRSMMAEWQSGYAADCKSVDLGSTPGSASIIFKNMHACPGGEIGRHKGLKIPRLNGRAGSIPALGTILSY